MNFIALRKQKNYSSDALLRYYKQRCELYENWLRAIDEHAQFDIWFKGPDNRFQFINRHFERTVGRSRSEIIDKRSDQVFGKSLANTMASADKYAVDQGTFEQLVPYDEDGHLEIRKEHHFALVDGARKPAGLGYIGYDLSEKFQMEDALSRAQSMAAICSWRWSIHNKCLISCSEQFASLLGVDADNAFDLMKDRLDRVVHPDDRDQVEQMQERFTDFEFEGYEIEYRVVRYDGETRFVRELAEPMRAMSGLPVEIVGTLQDITEQKQVERELLRAKLDLEARVEQRTAELNTLANSDPLTGLANRAYFRQELQRRFEESKRAPLAVILMDLNSFKEVNDHHGHSIGDALLQTVARRLIELCGDHALIARLGGDEFGIALTAPTSEVEQHAAETCLALLHVLQAPVKIGELVLHIDSAFGIGIMGQDEDNLEEVLKFADIALYHAKGSPESIVKFEPRMAEELALNKQLEQDLQQAITSGDIKVAYQPQYCVNGECIVGVEALARWSHPQHGDIAPATFVQIAEDCGLIQKLGNYVLDKACSEIGDLIAVLDRDIRLSVNISTKQFYEDNLTANFSKSLKKHDFDPNLLEIEITESVLIADIDHARNQIRQLRNMGIRVALDDFGTGYSSLSYLRRLEIDRIKLDREFIKDVGWCKYDRRVLNGIIALAQSLEIVTIAEGVEERQQRDILAKFGCDEIQGYYYSRPLPLDKLSELLEYSVTCP